MSNRGQLFFHLSITLEPGFRTGNLGFYYFETTECIILIQNEEYPLLNISSNTNLTKEEIIEVLSSFAYSSTIHTIKPLDKLKYNSLEEAVTLLQQTYDNNNIQFKEYHYYKEEPLFIPSGHPFLIGFGESSRNNTECVHIKLDLHTGESTCNQIPCEL